MTYLTIDEINNNPIYAPYPPFLRGKIMDDFIQSPVLLADKNVGKSSTWTTHTFKLPDTELPGFGNIKNQDHKIYNVPHIQLMILREYSTNLQRFDEVASQLKLDGEVTIVNGHKRTHHSTCDLEVSFTTTAVSHQVPDEYCDDGRVFSMKWVHEPGFKIRINIKSWTTLSRGSPWVKTNFNRLDDITEFFNVIEKEYKIMEEKKRDYYSRYFTKKPFFAFEETGIEVLFARKGYSIDGKRLPSFNRGSVWNLKQSLKENGIKQKGLTKKDDIIKALMAM